MTNILGYVETHHLYLFLVTFNEFPVVEIFVKFFVSSLGTALFYYCNWFFADYMFRVVGVYYEGLVCWCHVLVRFYFYSRLSGNSVCLSGEIKYWRWPIAAAWMSLESSSSVNTFFYYYNFFFLFYVLLLDGCSLIVFTVFGFVSSLLIHVLN